jgi:alcohol dehydrogenase class IV
VAAFEFATAARIVFGAGKSAEIAAAARAMGHRAMLVGSPRWRHLLPEAEVAFEVRGEPTVDVARAGTALARAEQCDVVVAIGGGSAIDAGKAIAALAANPGDVLDYIEVIGAGRPLQSRPLPFIAVPTTSGTGAEVTRNAVLGSPGDGVKASLRSPAMLPSLAIVDPELTRSLPREVAAYTGLDALTQLIEPLVSVRANAMSDMVARQGLALAVRGIRTLDREFMAQASLLSGMALANSGLGAVHAFAAAIGGMFPAVPHGAICAALLAPVMGANLAREPARYAGVPDVSWVEETVKMLEVKPLTYYGVDWARADEIVAKAQRSSSMKGNPVALVDEELHAVLSASAVMLH